MSYHQQLQDVVEDQVNKLRDGYLLASFLDAVKSCFYSLPEKPLSGSN